MAPSPPPRELVSDVISEILLRLPPDEPECLFRAALVCKPWLRTISDPAFLHRYRASHGTPPLLGLIHSNLNDGSWSFHLVPTRAAPAFPLPALDARRGCPFDCRHGCVLISMVEHWSSRPRRYYLVCDPVTGVVRDRLPDRLPQPEIRHGGIDHCAAAVFCAAVGCKHLDCHGGPFCVILMVRDRSARTLSAQFYSSEIGAWSEATTLQGIIELQHKPYGCGVLIGGAIYFIQWDRTGIIKYDWGKNCLSLINPPPSSWQLGRVTLMVMEDSSLGLANIKHSSLYLWSRRVSSEKTAEWVQCRVIDLEKTMPMGNPSNEASTVGFAEGVGVIFVSTMLGCL